MGGSGKNNFHPVFFVHFELCVIYISYVLKKETL